MTQDDNAKRISLAFHFRRALGAAARVAYPGSWVQRVGLENDKGCLVYVVSLSNGLEVKVPSWPSIRRRQRPGPLPQLQPDRLPVDLRGPGTDSLEPNSLQS